MAGDGPLDALCFAGGSLYGLEAAAGVAAELFARRQYATGWLDIAIVRGAVIFDFPPRSNAIYPDKALGRAALAAARRRLPARPAGGRLLGHRRQGVRPGRGRIRRPGRCVSSGGTDEGRGLHGRQCRRCDR